MSRSRPAAPGAFEARLGHAFQDRALLERALTPPSAGAALDNQRLEFLGDALLNAAVALLIHARHPQWEEGAMSKLRGLLVCTESLHRWALDLGLELRKGPRSTRKGGAAPSPKALADAVEALLAAAYLDAEAGGRPPFPQLVALVEARFGAEIGQAYPGIWETRDSKTTLQERAAALGWEAPVYATLRQSGPDHQPRFQVEVRAGGLAARAESGTIKGAEAEAARILLSRMN